MNLMMPEVNLCFAKNYEWILFDADETLFHFDAYGGLKLLFSKYEINFSDEDYIEYQKLNKSLWADYQNDLITAQELQTRRFNSWADRLGVSALELNSGFLQAMATICKPIDGAEDLLRALSGKVRMGIITNGFTELQQARLERTGLRDFFQIVVISEAVGAAKPHRRIFDHALSMMGDPSRDKVLMVGDTVESDILGGINSGLDTCWFNAHGKVNSIGVNPTYQVSSLKEIEQVIQ